MAIHNSTEVKNVLWVSAIKIYQKVCLVDVDWAGELSLFADHFWEDHDLLEEEASEGLHLGHPTSSPRVSPGPRGRVHSREVVDGVERAFVEQLALSSDFALKQRVGEGYWVVEHHT